MTKHQLTQDFNRSIASAFFFVIAIFPLKKVYAGKQFIKNVQFIDKKMYSSSDYLNTSHD